MDDERNSLEPEKIPPSEVVVPEKWTGNKSDYIREVAKRIRLQMNEHAQGVEFKDLLRRAVDMLDTFADVHANIEKAELGE